MSVVRCTLMILSCLRNAGLICRSLSTLMPDGLVANQVYNDGVPLCFVHSPNCGGASLSGVILTPLSHGLSLIRHLGELALRPMCRHSAGVKGSRSNLSFSGSFRINSGSSHGLGFLSPLALTTPLVTVWRTVSPLCLPRALLT